MRYALRATQKTLDTRTFCATLRARRECRAVGMRKMAALRFDLGKYLRDTESKNSKALLQNFEAIKLFLQAFENSDNTCVNTNNNYKYFVVDDINKIDCEKKEYKKAKDYNNEMYVGIENEKFALATLNAKYIKKNLCDIENRDFVVKNSEDLKKDYKFYTGFDKKLRDKLNVLLSKTENKSFNEFYFDIVNVCLNSEEIMYLMFEDKNNKENNFVLFKLNYARNYFGTSNKKMTFCDAFVLFFNRLDESKREHNFLVFKNVICEKEKMKYMFDEIKRFSDVEICRLKKFDNLDYFVIAASMKDGTSVISYDDIGEFDFCGVGNLKHLYFNKIKRKNEDLLRVTGLFESEGGNYEKVYIEKVGGRNRCCEIEYGYFDYTRTDIFSKHCVVSLPKQNRHKLAGAARVLFVCNEHGEIEDGNFNEIDNYNFYINGKYYKLGEYIESLRNLVSEKYLTEFLMKYTL